jgi:acyl-CoA thioesterase FadM
VVADTIPNDAFDALNETDHKLWKSLSGTIRMPMKSVPDDKLLGTYTASGTLYSDMWEHLKTTTSSLNIVTTFDLFEQSRTNFFGGQSHLKSLRENHSMAMVVGWMKECVIHEMRELDTRVPISCEFKVTLVRVSQNKTFELEQMIYVNGKSVATTRLCMVCVDWNTKQITELPGSYVNAML